VHYPSLHLHLYDASKAHGFMSLFPVHVHRYAVEPTAAHRPSSRACPAFQRLYNQATGAPLDACTKRPARLQCAPKPTAAAISGADAAFGMSSFSSSLFSSASSRKHNDAFDPFGHLGRGNTGTNDLLEGFENHDRSGSSGGSSSNDGGALASALAVAARKRAAALFHAPSFLYPSQPMPPLPHELARDSRLLVDYQSILDKHRDSYSKSRSLSNDDAAENANDSIESEDDDTSDLKDGLRDEDDCCWELDDDTYTSGGDVSGSRGDSGGKLSANQQESHGSGSNRSPTSGKSSSNVGKSSKGSSSSSKKKGVVGIMAKKGEGSASFEGSHEGDDDDKYDDDEESNDQAAAVEENAARSALEAIVQSSGSSSTIQSNTNARNGNHNAKAAGDSLAEAVLHDLVLHKRDFTAPIMPAFPSSSGSDSSSRSEEEDPLATVFGAASSSISCSGSVINGEVQRSEGDWVNYDHRRASRYAQAATTTNRDVAEKRKSVGRNEHLSSL